VVWERFVRSAPGDVGKQHRAHLGVAAECFSLDHLLVVPPKESLTELTINNELYCCIERWRCGNVALSRVESSGKADRELTR